MQPKVSRRIGFLIISVICFLNGLCQKTSIKYELEIGQPFPNISLNEMHYSNFKNAAIHDYRGKWLIIDFWHKHCIACVESFPGINKLRKEFAGKIEYILIGRQDSERQIQPLYEKFRKKYALEIPIIFDSSLHNTFGISACPYVIIIDPNGIIRGITNSLTSDDIKAFLAGKIPILNEVYAPFNRKEEISYDYKAPFLINGNGGSDTNFFYRSLLSHWSQGMPLFTPSSLTGCVTKLTHTKFEVLGVSLAQLYNYAYLDYHRPTPIDSVYGKVTGNPILKIDDSTLFRPVFDKGLNMFCYSVILNDGRTSVQKIRDILKSDLKTYFGFEADVEMRSTPCWKLISIDSSSNKLKTKGGKSQVNAEVGSKIEIKNGSVNNLIYCIWAYFQDDPPLINETGISGNIDINLDTVLTDFESVRKALQKNGLDLVSGQKEMKVVVIRDANHNQIRTNSTVNDCP